MVSQQYGISNLVGIAVQARDLLAQVTLSQPDVLILDWFLPGQPAVEFLADVRALERRPQIIVLSVRPEVERAAMAAGAYAFVSKAESADRLIDILHRLRDSNPAP